MKTITETVFNEILSDDSPPENEHQRILLAYQSASIDERTKIDDIFISLCGWSMETLIKKTEIHNGV